MASPAMIFRSCLVDNGTVIMPIQKNKTIGYKQVPDDNSVLSYVSSMPDEVDRLIAVYDVAGKEFGRIQNDGKMMFHMGLKVIIRAPTYSGGWDLAQVIANAIDSISKVETIIDEVVYSVQNVYRVGSIISLGEEVSKKRQLFTINARIVFPESQSRIG